MAFQHSSRSILGSISAGRPDDAAALDRIVSAIDARRRSSDEPNTSLCPYRDLRVFREKMPLCSSGARRIAPSLLTKVLRHPFVAVVGASGSGKSSLVRAGLLPRLRVQRPPADTWEAVVFTPGTRPYHRLAAELVRLWSAPDRTHTSVLAESEDLGNRLELGQLAMREAVHEALKLLPNTTRLLIVVDQFEEIFALSSPASFLPSLTVSRRRMTRLRTLRTMGHQRLRDPRKRFIEEILALAQESATSVVITLRGDFYGYATTLSREAQ